MWLEIHWGNRHTVGHETQGTKTELGSRSSVNIQTSTTFICRELPYTLERSEDFKTGKNPVYRKYKVWPAWPVYKILLGYPALKFLPSGTCWSGMECLNNMFNPMKIRNLSTVGVSGGWIFSARVMVLYEVSMVWSFWVFIALFMVLILICSVFQMTASVV